MEGTGLGGRSDLRKIHIQILGSAKASCLQLRASDAACALRPPENQRQMFAT